MSLAIALAYCCGSPRSWAGALVTSAVLHVRVLYYLPGCDAIPRHPPRDERFFSNHSHEVKFPSGEESTRLALLFSRLLVLLESRLKSPITTALYLGSGIEMDELTVANGAVSGWVRIWLRAEGFGVFAFSILLYKLTGSSWWLFLTLFLAPDLAILGYLISSRVGGACYNVVHSYISPLILATVAVMTARTGILPHVFIWTAHIGVDRCLGYGLKYSTAFRKTHLGNL